MTTQTLKPNPQDKNKSYYGKAKIHIHDDGTIELQSYSTIVARITPDHIFHKLWGGYSDTTMRHIKTFCDNYNITHGGKSWWQSLPTTTKKQYKIYATNGIMTYNQQVIFDNYADAQEYADKMSNGFWVYCVEEV